MSATQGGLMEGLVEAEELVGGRWQWEEDGIVHQIDVLTTRYPAVNLGGLGQAKVKASCVSNEHLEESPRLYLSADEGAIQEGELREIPAIAQGIEEVVLLERY
jgi:hypothetical protein